MEAKASGLGSEGYLMHAGHVVGTTARCGNASDIEEKIAPKARRKFGFGLREEQDSSRGCPFPQGANTVVRREICGSGLAVADRPPAEIPVWIRSRPQRNA